MANPITNGDKRNPNGTFAVGNPGGPGRPEGSISVIAKIKQKFYENPEYFDEWTDKLMEDPRERRAIMEQIDGKPRQPIVGDKDNPIVMQVIKYDGDSDTV